MLKTVYIDTDLETLIENGESIIVDDISINHVTGIAISPMQADIFESDGITKICRVQSAGVFNSSFGYEMANHTFQLTTPFLAPRGVKIKFYSAGLATMTISYRAAGA